MATITIGQLLEISKEKSDVMSFDDVVDAVKNAGEEALQILIDQAAALLLAIEAIATIVAAYNALVDAIKVASDAKEIIEAAVPVMGASSGAKTVAKKAVKVGSDLLTAGKDKVVDLFLNTPITIPGT